MLQLNKIEKDELVTNCDRFNKLKFSTSLPYAFTEHGSLMAASVLNSKRASEISIYTIRAFVKIGTLISQNNELEKKFIELEKKLSNHDKQLLQIIATIKQLLDTKITPKKNRIGFE